MPLYQRIQKQRFIVLVWLILGFSLQGCSTAPEQKTTSAPQTKPSKIPVDIQPKKRPEIKKPTAKIEKTIPVEVVKKPETVKPKPTLPKTNITPITIKRETTKEPPKKQLATKLSTKAPLKPVQKKKVKIETKETSAPTISTKQSDARVIAKKVSNDTPKVIQQILVTQDKLPLTIKNWIIDKSSTSSPCIFKTQSARLEDGAGGTPVFINIESKRITVHTKSDIDLSYPNSQFRISGQTFKFDKVVSETNAILEESYIKVLEALKNANMVSIDLGFWPSWPHTQTYTTTIPTDGFEVAYNAWQQCNKI